MSLPDLPPPPLAPEVPKPDPHAVETLRGLAARLGPWQGVVGPASGCLGLAAIAALAEVIAPMLLGQIIDGLWPGSSGGVPWLLFGAYAVALVASVAFDRWGDVQEVGVAGRLMAQVHVRLLSDRLLAQESLAGKHTESAARLAQATQAVGELFRSGIAGPIRTLLAVVATVVMASTLSAALGLASLVWAGVLLAGAMLVAPRTGRLADEEQRARSAATHHAAETMGIADTLRRARAEPAEIERGLGLAFQVRDRLMARTLYVEWRLGLIGILQAGFVLTVLAIGLAGWKAGTTTPGQVAAAVGLALALMDNLIWAGQQVALAQAARGTLTGILGDWPGGKRRLWWGKNEGVEERGLERIPGEHGLVLRDVRVGPLARLNMEIEPGEHTGVVGPQDMRLALFGALNGQAAVKEGTLRWGQDDWTPGKAPAQREEIVRIAAQPTLFERSLAQNVWLDDTGDRPLPEHLARLVSFVEPLPQGWQTQAGKQGHKLSLDQRLRLVVVRALLDPPTWLVLDELPGGEVGERLLRDVRAALTPGTTLVVGLRHPVPTDLLVSVVVLAHGRVVEDGNPADLLAHGRHYAKWVERKTGGNAASIFQD